MSDSCAPTAEPEPVPWGSKKVPFPDLTAVKAPDLFSGVLVVCRLVDPPPRFQLVPPIDADGAGEFGTPVTMTPAELQGHINESEWRIIGRGGFAYGPTYRPPPEGLEDEPFPFGTVIKVDDDDPPGTVTVTKTWGDPEHAVALNGIRFTVQEVKDRLADEEWAVTGRRSFAWNADGRVYFGVEWGDR